ncbi:hypothetical protein HK102_005014, partial [Quaeritorhiza haematococci]
PFPEYQRRVALGLLKPDEDQMRAVVKLDRLCEDLLDYRPPEIIQFKFNPSTGTPLKIASGVDELTLPDLKAKSLVPIISPEDTEPNFVGPRGLWLYGEVGTGKTFVMDLFYENMPVERKKRIHFHEFMQLTYAKINHWQKVPVDRQKYPVLSLVARDFVSEAWLLCFDEFQVTDIATAAIMKQLFEYMFRLGAVVVATSNRLPDDLYKGGFQRELYSTFIDLLNDRCEVQHLRSSTDYRVEILRDKPLAQDKSVFFRRDDPEQATAFVERVSRLFYGENLRKKTLKVYGRDVVIPKSANGKALFTFEELCGSSNHPLGAADYLAICREYHTIILQSIPQMGLLSKNEARRFITFIDAAYENKVQLICSADAEPEDLFIIMEDPADPKLVESADMFMHREMMGDLMGLTGRGRLQKSAHELMKLAIFTAEDERFAFRRAVSRLKEMMSETWAASAVEHARVVREKKAAQTNAVPQRQKHSSEPSIVLSASTLTAPTEPPTIDAQQQYGQQKDVIGDFGDEASYAGYINLYKRYNPKETSSTILERIKQRNAQKPRFNKDTHFWGMLSEGLGPKARRMWGGGSGAAAKGDEEKEKGKGKK